MNSWSCDKKANSFLVSPRGHFCRKANSCALPSFQFAMGHAASVDQAYRKRVTVFVSHELVASANALQDNEVLRTAFLNYIKSGEWLESITKAQKAERKSITREARLAIEHNNLMYAYATSDATRRQFSQMESSQSTATKSGPATTGSLTTRIDALFGTESDQIESYFPIDKFCCFNQQELVSVMISVLLPLFEKCPDYDKYLKHGMVEDREDTSTTDGNGAPSQFTKSSRRAQDCLLSCAANCQESELWEHLSSPRWPDHVDSAFDNYHLPISVIDANQAHRPFLFVNKAFETMYGSPRVRILGKNMDILCGPETELALSAHLQEALRTNVSCKVALTHYSAGKKKFLDFVAFRACGGYTFAVHCPGDSEALLEDVKVSFVSLFLRDLCTLV
jgi:PAS domain-containing protein